MCVSKPRLQPEIQPGAPPQHTRVLGPPTASRPALLQQSKAVGRRAPQKRPSAFSSACHPRGPALHTAVSRKRGAPKLPAHVPISSKAQADHHGTPEDPAAHTCASFRSSRFLLCPSLCRESDPACQRPHAARGQLKERQAQLLGAHHAAYKPPSVKGAPGAWGVRAAKQEGASHRGDSAVS